MKQLTIEEVRNTHSDNNYIHIDAYFIGEEEGKTVAIVCEDTRKVFFIDNSFRNDRLVKESIAEVIKDLNEKVSDTDFFKSIDYSLLRGQKQGLLTSMDLVEQFPNIVESLNGILNLVDSIQDYAIARGYTTEAEALLLTGE